MTRSRLAPLLLVLLMLPFAGPAGAAGAEDDVRAATARWIDAFNRKDAKGLVALYAPDAVFFGTTSPVLRDSPELVWGYFQGLPRLADSVMSVGDARVQVLGDTAVHTGFYTRSQVRDGKTVENRARFTFVYARRGGEWRIVTHHSSAAP